MSRARTSMAMLLSLVLAVTVLAPVGAAAQDNGDDDTNVLVFSATAEFRHDSIEAGIAAIEQLGEEHGFAVDATEDAEEFNEDNLAGYDAVVWLSTTGDVLDEDQQAAFESYIQSGGGYAGIHAASDTHYDWEWYGQLVGGYFDGHPPGTQDAEVWVTDQAHPSTDMLPSSWDRHDEWYDFHINPRGDVHVLATLNEDSYIDDIGDYDGMMGDDHPIAWCHDYDGGRSWYTGGGHTEESFTEEEPFLDHMAGGIMWAAGMVEGDCGGTVWDSYDKVVLEDDVLAPMALEVSDDGRVFVIERSGEFWIIDPETDETALAAEIDVFTGEENGLMGVALDPDFNDNDRIWLAYSPPDDVVGDEPRQHVSSFDLADDGTLDLDSEEVVLEIPHQRDECCHSGGYIAFGPDGDLWIGVGDDTNPFESDAYAPIDEREGREPFDAQRTSANTNDLRGSLLRITPSEDGSDYTIPDGNLFEEGTEDTLPEIHTMGLRNPFRFSVDPHDPDVVYLADYGPDANEPDPDRGPENQVTWRIIDEAQNAGWPYCKGPNRAYVDYDFDTEESGDEFDCDNLINDSPNNTGLTEIPPSTPATVWYSYEAGDDFPMLAGGAPTGGPRYAFDEDLDSDIQWPASFDGSVIFGEWGANQLFEFGLSDDGLETTQIAEMLPDETFLSPMDFVFGPHDGALYMIEWGADFGDPDETAQVVRVDYHGFDAEAPQVSASADPSSGEAPLEVNFTGEATSPVDDDIESFAWDFDDGNTADEADTVHTYEESGTYQARLTATDTEGRTGSATVNIQVEDDEGPPPVELPCVGDVGDEIFVSDFEDGETQGWESAAGMEQVAVSDELAYDGDFSLLTTDRSEFYMGPERDLTDELTPGETYQFSTWLHLADNDSDDAAELYFVGITEEDGDQEFDAFSGEVAVTGDDWVELTGTWTVPSAADAAAVKVEGGSNEPFHLDDFTIAEVEPGERPELHSDEFEGDELDGCRWDQVVRYDPTTLEVADGELLIDTPDGDIFMTPNDPVTNLVLQTQPDGDWTVETALTEELVSDFQQAGLMVYLDDDNYVKFDVIADEGADGVNRVELRSEIDGEIQQPEPDIDAPDNDGQWWLRLTKEGDEFFGQVSADGEEWIDTEESVPAPDVAEDGAVGLFTLGVNQDEPTTVAFDYFRVDGEDEDPDAPSIEVALDPAEPDGPDGVYVSPVTVSLSSDDDEALLEWRMAGDEDWVTYTDPVTFDEDGSYEIEAQASNDDGTSDIASVSFTIAADEEPPPEGTVCERHQGGATFPDASGSGHRAFIDCLAELGVVEGKTDGTFAPRESVSREQLASFTVRSIELATGESLPVHDDVSFPDVNVNSTHGEAVLKLASVGIVRGYEDGTFGPRDSVARDQTARYVVNSLELLLDEPLDTSGASFPDVADGSQYAEDVDKLATAGIIQGYEDGRYGPREPVSRAQMTRFIGNALELAEAEGAYEGP